MLKNASFLEKSKKIASASRDPPQTPVYLRWLGAPTALSCFFSRKCVLLPLKMNKITTGNVLFLLFPDFCTYFLRQTVVFVTRGARIFLAPGRRVPSRRHCVLVPFLKGELGELKIYFRKIPLHQQKFLVVSVLSNSPWLPRNSKNVPK